MRRPRRLPHPAHPAARTALRAFGALFAIAGVVFAAVGLLSFFQAFGDGVHGPPRYFWCVFVGLPLLGIGTAMLNAGYLGAVTRYVATETVPVAADAVHDLAHGTRDALRAAAGAVGEGLRGAPAAAATCAACGAAMAPDARFCSHCGTAADTARSCADCGRDNAPAARFCAGCGSALAAG